MPYNVVEDDRKDRELQHAALDDLYLNTAGRIDARCAVVDGYVDAFRADIADGLYAWNMESGNRFNAAYSDIGGELNLRSATVDGDVTLDHATITGDAQFTRLTADEITAKDCTVDGRFVLRDTEVDSVDIRGATLGVLDVDDFDAYDFQADDDTTVYAFREGTGMPAYPEMTSDQESFARKLANRPRLPLDADYGICFSYDDLDTDPGIVMDDHRKGVLGALTAKDVIKTVADDQFLLRTDVL